MNYSEKEKGKIISQKNQPKLEIEQKEYFFYLIGFDDYNFNRYSFYIINQESKEPIEFKIEDDTIKYGSNSSKQILYFKLICKINSSIEIIYEHKGKDKKFYPMKLSENSLLGFIKIFNNIENKLLIKERNIIYNANLLSKFKCDINLMSHYIENYKSDLINKDEIINFEEFTSLLKIFNEFNNISLFLKELKLNNIAIYKNSENRNIYQTQRPIYDLIIKNPKDELIDIYLLILYKFDENEFYKILETGNIYKNSAIRLFKKCEVDMDALNKIIPEVILSFSKEELNALFVKYYNIEKTLNFILENFEIIADNLKKKNQKITFDLPRPTSNDNIKNIFDIHQKINEKQKNCDLINIDTKKLINNLINFNKDYNVRKLIDLKKYYFKQESIFYKFLNKFFGSRESNDELVKIIHQTGINLSKEKKLKNSDIIYFVLNDKFYSNDDYSKFDGRDLNVFENSWELSESNIEEFVEMKPWKIFENKIDKLYQIFINKVEKLDDIDILFRLFPFDKSVGLKKENKFIDLLLKKINNIEDYSYIGTKKDKTKLFNNCNFIFTHCNKNIDTFTEIVESKNFFENETIKELYMYILSNCKNCNENNAKELLTFFEKYLDILDVDDAFELIQSLSFNQKIIDKLFNNEKFQSNVFTEKNFFMREKFSTIALYEKLLNENILMKFNKTKYYNNSKKVINNIKNKLQELQVEYLEVKVLYENNQLKNRLYLLFPEKSQNNELENNYNKIIETLNVCENNLIKLSNRIEYLELFDRQNEKKRDEYLKKYQELKNGTLYAIKSEKIFDEKFNKFHNEQVLKSLKYNKCLIFMKLFNKISQKNKDNEAFKETFKLFKDIFLKIIKENGIEEIMYYKEEENKDKIKQLEDYKNSFKIILELIKEKKDEQIKKEIKFVYEIINEDGGLTEDQYKIINNVRENDKNLELLVNKLKCFSYFNDIKYSINCLINLFKNLNLKNENYQVGKISSRAEDIYKILSGKAITYANLQDANNFLKEMEIDIFETKNNNFYTFIVEIIDKKDEIEFCEQKKNEFKDSEDDITVLKDLIQENENGDLDAQDIDIFIECLKFFCSILDKRNKDEIELLSSIKDKIKNDETIIQSLKNYFEKYGEIKRFFEEFNKSESIESKITKILKKFFFRLYREENQILLIGEDKEKNKLELKDLLKLERKFTFSNDKDKYIKAKEEICKFKNIINKLRILKEKLENLILLDYKKYIEINFILENGVIKNTENSKDIIDMSIKEYDGEIKKKKSEICTAYEKNPFLRFIPMNLFSFIGSIIEDFENKFELGDEKNNQLQFLLKAISNGKIEITKLDESNFSGKEFFLKANNFIKGYFDLNDLNKNDLEPVFAQNKFKIKEYKSGIYRAVYKNKDISLINLYIKITGNMPLTNTVFICNEYTTLEAIQSFLYLSCKCKRGILFCLVGIEKLHPEKRIEALDFIKKYKEKENEMDSILLILYLKDGNIKDNLAKIIPIESIKYEESENIRKIQYQDNNIEIFKSKYTGYGKSRMISNKILEEKRKGIYFPLGGDLTREEILKRFFNLNLSANNMQNYCIHIDLYETKFKELLRDILFEILVLKKIEYNGKIIYFEKIKFFIEIQNGYYNYLDEFPLLNLFKINNIENMIPIQFNPNIEKIKDCKFRIVANFLNAYDNDALRKENIDLDIENSLTDQDCIRLFEKYLKFTENNYNYYQIICCIKFLSFQFLSFNELQILKEEKDEKKTQFNDKLYEIRKMIIEYIIDVVAFLKTPFEKLIKSQTESLKDCKENPNQQAIKSLEQLKDKIEHFTLIPFCGDKSTYRLIPKNKEDENKYKKIYDFFCTIYGSKGNLFSSNNLIKDYSKGDHYFFLEELKTILGLNEIIFDITENEELNSKLMEQTKGKLDPKIYHPHTNDYELDKVNIDIDRKLYMAKLAKLNGNYIYTLDNFYKTILIYYRIQSGIPVILMGETGCGKTSLLNMLSTFMYRGTSKMKILKCHAGTNDNDIIKFINDIENNMEKEEEEELNKIMKKFDDEKLSELYDRDKHKEIHEKRIKERKIWVFFDELNTCDSIGLITEIICKKTMLGKQLSEKLLFLGAMNPYRAMTDKMKQSGLRYPTDKKKELVYSVNPLPHTLMNFVINFGNLGENEEKEYIEAILLRGLEKFTDETINFNDFLNFASNCISKCHNFIREQSDISDVSLREISRMNVFFDFFFDYLSTKSGNKHDYSDIKTRLYYSLNLSIYSCYYLRISDNKGREVLSNQLSKFFSEHSNIKDYNFLDIPDKEVSFITEQFIIDKQKGIILNKSLKENLFSAFISIINKIPLIIVGKPGESKSLSIQIIMKSMKGIYSKNEFFKKYPSIFKFDYQGSITSTSKGIIEAFNKARNYSHLQKEKILNKKTNEELIVLLFFDEMGLAERSPNNPLKAIHGELEYSQNDDKIAFIAISNWKIDASKMNRCNILSKQINSDEEELIKTAKLIYKELYIDDNNSKLIEALTKSYYNIIKDDQSNFFGTRDFYYLIREASREIRKLEKAKDNITHEKLTKIGLKAISRNFGGDEIKLGNFKKNFEEAFICDKNSVNIFNNEYNILHCISDNICDYNSRYLMLIIENLASIKALENIISNQNKEYYILQSQFNDNYKNSESEIDIIENILNQIKYFMTKECVLILKDLDSIYPSLYELFNQNYMKFGDKYFTKIAFSNSKVSSEVNPRFRIILLVTKEQINNNKIDIPLLNRFEKQKVKFEELISDNDIKNFGKLSFKYKDLIKRIIDKWTKISTFKEKDKEYKFRYNLSKLMIFTENQIKWVIKEILEALTKNEKKINDNNIEVELYKKIVPLFCQDIIASVKYSSFEQEYKETAQLIYELYKKIRIDNFSEFINKRKKNKNIIYTFSNIFDSENFIPKEKVDKFEIKNEIKSEKEINEILNYYKDQENKEYLIFKLEEINATKLNYLTSLINNFETENKLKKIIILIYHINKDAKENEKMEFLCNLDDHYDKFFIDNLANEQNNFDKILNKNNIKDLFNSMFTISEIDTILRDNLKETFKLFEYNFKNIFGIKEIKDYLKMLNINFYKKRIKDKKLFDLIKEKTLNMIFQNEEDINKNINNLNEKVLKMLTTKHFISNKVDFYHQLKSFFELELKNSLFSVIKFLEKRGVLSSLFLPNNNNENILNNEKIQNQILNIFKKEIIIEPIPSKKVKISIINGLTIPSINFYFNEMISFLNENIKAKYLENEYSVRIGKIKEKEEYDKNLGSLVDQIIIKIRKHNEINEIFEDSENSEELMKYFYYDYLNIYCLECNIKEKIKENPIKFLEYILQLKFSDKKNVKTTYYKIIKKLNINYFSEIFIFLECYKDEIMLLLKANHLFNSIMPETFDLSDEIINIYEKTEDDNLKNIVNEIFNILIESYIKLLFKNKDKISYFKYEIKNIYEKLKYIEIIFNQITKN